jgi:hypothetical protein
MAFAVLMLYSDVSTIFAFMEIEAMGKERDAKKEEKKQPTKNAKEKKQEKADKKAARESKYN